MTDKKELTLWSLIKEDFGLPKKNDPALHSKFELIFNYPGVWAIVNYRIANRLYRKGFKRLGRFVSGISQLLTNTDIHPCATIGQRVFIDHGFGVVIGETTVIENDVLIYQGVTLGGVSLTAGKRHPTIRSNVVIGSGAKVLGNIIIGKNSKIGANSVVIKDVSCGSTAVGIPARIIKRRDKDCDDNKSKQLNHSDLPDISKEMFNYLIKRIAVLEDAIKIEDGIDVSKEDKELESTYENFIDAMKKE